MGMAAVRVDHVNITLWGKKCPHDVIKTCNFDVVATTQGEMQFDEKFVTAVKK